MKRRIFYYDTDCGGVVYYANYLKFLEEARTFYMEEKGISVKKLMDDGVWFVVKRQEIDYKAPAVYFDELEVKTSVKEITSYRIIFEYQTFNQGGLLLNKAVTEMVCVDKNLKILEIPKEISQKIK